MPVLRELGVYDRIAGQGYLPKHGAEFIAVSGDNADEPGGRGGFSPGQPDGLRYRRPDRRGHHRPAGR